MIASSAVLVACLLAAEPPKFESPTIPVTVETIEGSVRLEAELAMTPAARTRGLMYRRALPKLGGMLFVFPDERPRSFWMKNTPLALDMIFIGADRRVVGIVRDAVPQTTTRRGVSAASQFVLELEAGTAARLGILPGQQVKFFAPIPQR